jgi:hypothetical protein
MMHAMAHKGIEKFLKKTQGYVLLTCSKPDDKGDMQVEMSFDGDPDLLLYLLDGAKERIDEDVSCDTESFLG